MAKAKKAAKKDEAQVETVGDGYTPPAAAVEAQERAQTPRVLPTLGRVVIYRDSAGTEMAAIVAGLTSDTDLDADDDRVSLAVLHPRMPAPAGLGAVVFKHAVGFDAAGAPETWAWPKRS